MGKVREENEVAKWEMQEGSKMARLERWESVEVGRQEAPSFVYGWAMQGESKISSFCF